MGSEVKIAYICDGLCECSDKPGCFRHMKNVMDVCNHTFDPKHALHGPVDNPEDFPERFHKLIPNDELCYWEGDVYIPWP